MLFDVCKMHLSRETYIEGLKAEAVGLAKALIANEVEFIVAIRHLSCLRHEIGTSSSDEDFNLFLIIDSQTDHLPAGGAKAFCSPEWLQKSGKEVEDSYVFYHVELMAACRKIIERFSVSQDLR